MKTSFTTLACPDWTVDRVIDAAVESIYVKNYVLLRKNLEMIQMVQLMRIT